MAAGTVTIYSKNNDILDIGEIVGATIKMALCTSTYTPDASVTGHYRYADLTNELSTANGYTSGGATLTTLASTAITKGYKFASDNVAWTASGGSIPAWRYGVLYISGTFNGKTNPLIGYFLGDSTPADVPATTTGNTLTITCPSGGWFDDTSSP